jgi:glucose-1-phosphate thymidylyltransferase
MTNYNRSRKNCQEVVGLLPAAGKATRLARLPCSKELYPIGFQNLADDRGPKPVCIYLLEKMRLAGISKAYIILRKGKWDIPAYLRDGSMLGMHLAYLMMNLPFGVPYTLDQAYPFLNNSLVALGFPDIIFKPDDAFVELIARQARSNADIVLALFPAHQPQKTDMVDVDDNGRIRGIQIKPAQTHLRYAWVIAVWSPVFTQFMHEYLTRIQDISRQNNTDSHLPESRELFVGDVIQAAIENRLSVEGVSFQEGSYLDIGTQDNLFKAIRDSILQEPPEQK